jgi:sterol desaturase/sphingolipid hydroxylase (fatty acid hydroxylase superfamily)
MPTAAPQLGILLLHLLVCFLLFDASYFLWHWCHHASPVLYKHIHSLHHQYRAPFVWVTQHEHALELLPVSLWSVTIPMALGCHPLTEWLFLLGAIQVSVEAHSGYDIGFTAPLAYLLPAWGGTRHHDDHHKFPTRNFEPFFTYLDDFFSTRHVEGKAMPTTPTPTRGEHQGTSATLGGSGVHAGGRVEGLSSNSRPRASARRRASPTRGPDSYSSRPRPPPRSLARA